MCKKPAGFLKLRLRADTPSARREKPRGEARAAGRAMPQGGEARRRGEIARFYPPVSVKALRKMRGPP